MGSLSLLNFQYLKLISNGYYQKLWRYTFIYLLFGQPYLGPALVQMSDAGVLILLISLLSKYLSPL